MLTDPFLASYETEDPEENAVARSFAITEFTPNGTVRRCFLENEESLQTLATGAPGRPNTMKISHLKVGKGSTARTRHLFRLEANKVIDVEGGPTIESPELFGALYLVLDIPNGSEGTGQVEDLWRQFLGAIRDNSGAPIVLPPEEGGYFGRLDLNGSSFLRRFMNGES